MAGGEAGGMSPYGYRRDPAVPSFPDDRPVIIFDGMCVFCSGFAHFIIRRDRHRRFRFLAAQTPTGEALYRHFGLDPVAFNTNILLQDGSAWLFSEGSIRIFEQLGFPWRLMSAARLIPRPVRDRLYDFVARNRLRWFGVRTSCFLPDPAEADRFIAG
jgi:predicted DCC family thiol-disulfide oxidoreductase YuxK